MGNVCWLDRGGKHRGSPRLCVERVGVNLGLTALSRRKHTREYVNRSWTLRFWMSPFPRRKHTGMHVNWVSDFAIFRKFISALLAALLAVIPQ